MKKYDPLEKPFKFYECISQVVITKECSKQFVEELLKYKNEIRVDHVIIRK